MIPVAATDIEIVYIEVAVVAVVDLGVASASAFAAGAAFSSRGYTLKEENKLCLEFRASLLSQTPYE